MKLAICIAILVTGLVCGWVYLFRPLCRGEGEGERPWRRLGGGICVVLGVMFAVGVWLVDIPERPRPYAAFWLVMLVLVAWLCVLAVRDLAYTRRQQAARRAERAKRMALESAGER